MQRGVYSQGQVHGAHLYQRLRQEAVTISIWEQQLQVAVALKIRGGNGIFGLNSAQSGFL